MRASLPPTVAFLLALFCPLQALAQDTTAPANPTISIAGGAAYTTSAIVSLSLSATDAVGVTQMCISNATSCTSWLSYATTYSWNIGSTPQGTRTVYVKYRDAAGNVSSQVSDTIVLDSTSPTNGTATAATASSGELDVSWSGFSDASSGVASYTVAYKTGSSPASKCTSGSTLSTTGTTTTLTGLSDGTTYYIRVCAVDAAGNVSTGATTTAVPVTESNPPTGTVVINSGSDYTSSGSVTLTLAATDDSGVSQMCVSNTTSCTVYSSYTTTRSWSFSGTGLKTVYVYFKDLSGNISEAATDTIIVDTSAPTNGVVAATASDGQIDLSWSGFADTISGIASYKVVQGTSGAPASCGVGTSVYTGSATSLTLTGLENGTRYYYRVCAVNNAGLTSTGATASDIPASEFDPPVNATISIDDDAVWTNSTSVELALYAEDVSGIEEVCVSNTASCTLWTPYTATRNWTLGGSGLTRTVYAWYKDDNGNVTPSSVSDTIQIDTIKPTDGTASGTPGTVSVDVSWSGYIDTISGVSSYKVVYTKAAVAPFNCTLGNVGYTGTATSATVTGLTDGAVYTFRVCAYDLAGNLSNGTTFSVTTLQDLTPPEGTVFINDDALYTNNPNMLLNLDATDDLSGVGRACISEDPDDCAHWEAYTTETDWSFSPVEGEHTIYVWYEDGAQNLMDVPASDTIILDMTAPEDGTVEGSFLDSSTIELSWADYTDALSGVEGYIVAYNLDGSTPDSCTSADIQEDLTDTSTLISGVIDALPYGIRVCAYDYAGNLSDGTVEIVSACTATTWYADGDGDGFGTAGSTTLSCDPPVGYVDNTDDCDDSDASINPDGTEVCNSADDDCNGLTDDSAVDMSTWYRDADSDSYGGNITTMACDQPSGFVANTDDCDDSRALVNPAGTEICNDRDDDCNGMIDDSAVDMSTWYLDADSDSYGGDTTTMACDQPSGYVTNTDDCNDSAASINPDGTEVCNSADDDCNGMIDDSAIDASTFYGDVDEDGYGDITNTITACSMPAGYVSDDSDCDDSNQDIFPGATELCNGFDDDCDGVIDDGTADADVFYADTDGDNYGDLNNSVTACVQPPGYVTDTSDCDDSDVMVHPGVDELCNSVDDDCDGAMDEDAIDMSMWYADNDLDNYGDVNDSVMSCDAPAGYIADDSDCDDTDIAVYPGADEYCNDVDDDCNGMVDDNALDATIWYIDADTDMYGDLGTSIASCDPVPGYVDNSGDCNDANTGINPGADEYCDGVDEDCSGLIDDGALDASIWYADSDTDGFGDVTTWAMACTAPAGYIMDSTDCDDDRALTNPAADEYCNGEDDDCSGTADDGSPVDGTIYYADGDTDTYGNPTNFTIACSMPAGYVANDDDCHDGFNSVHPGADEYCNGRDDDCNGAIDNAPVDGTVYYADTDVDTYGDLTNTVTACSMPAGYVVNSTDCDDGDGAVNPGEVEVCNSLDDDCNGLVDDNPSGTLVWYQDVDGDTYGDPSTSLTTCSPPSGYVNNADDCDDGDVAVHPTASEVCNTVDDDCDGFVNNDAIDAQYWYADVDGDSFGDAGSFELLCDPLAGYVLDDTDCDDTMDTIYPGADEYCNELDDDCNGEIDNEPVDGFTWYLDVDGDSYGDPSVPVTFCIIPSGYSEFDTDCDDTDAAINPDATEVCFDGADNDCDGSAAGCEIVGPWVLSDIADDVLIGEDPNNQAGYSVSAAGDVDFDGNADILVGAPGPVGGSTYPGTVYLAYGPIVGPTDLSLAEVELKGETNSDLFGLSIAGIGDADGDGERDFLFSADGDDDIGSESGAAYLVLGPVTADAVINTVADAKYRGESLNDRAGRSVASVGDFTGDGNDDMLVGAFGDDDGGTNAGAAYIMDGTALGTISLGTRNDLKVIGENATDRGGIMVSGVGDTNGDGIDDMLVGSDQYDYSGRANSGAVYLVYGGISGTLDLSLADARFFGAAAGNLFGSAIAGPGDVNLDGVNDVLIGAYLNDDNGTDAGAAYLFQMPPWTTGYDAAVDADVIFYGETGAAQAGRSVAGAGDVDGDGSADMLIGAPSALDTVGGSGLTVGASYLMLGPLGSGMSLTLDGTTAQFYGSFTSDYVGWSAANVGDTDNNGYPEFAIGAYGVDVGGTSAGAVFVLPYYGL